MGEMTKAPRSLFNPAPDHPRRCPGSTTCGRDYSSTVRIMRWGSVLRALPQLCTIGLYLVFMYLCRPLLLDGLQKSIFQFR